MKNRERLAQTCIYDLLVSIEKNVGICPLQAVGLSRDNKIIRCYSYVKDGCEICIQNWLNESENSINQVFNKQID